MRTLIAALLTGIAATSIAALVAPPTRRLGPRLAPYAQRARALVGHNADTSAVIPPPQLAVTGVFGPVVAAGALRLSGLPTPRAADSVQPRRARRRDRA